jgi:hypothetical protein
MSVKQPSFVEMLSLLPTVARLWYFYKTRRYKEFCYLFNSAMPMRSTEKMKEAFAGYTPTKHDVFVCTYAKSGTYWTMQIAHQIAHYGEAEFEHVHDVIPWPDVFMPSAVTLEDTRPQENSPTGLRVIKTHLDSQYIPYNPDAKYIIVVRDPKEAFVSSYHFARALSPFGRMDFQVDEWMELFLENQSPYGSWAEHAASFWTWRKKPGVLYITFDELKKNHRAVSSHIAELMGVKLTEAQLDKVVEKSSFQYMQKIDDKFTPRMPMIQKNQPSGVMIRKGESGKSDELINFEQQAIIDRFCQDELKRLGSDFPYTEMFKLAAKKQEIPALV